MLQTVVVGRREQLAGGDDTPEREATSVADRLLASSTRFARTAMEAYVAESWEVFYLHLSTAVEQLLKSVLAAMHPSLIVDKGADFDSLLHLSGLGHRAHTPESAVRTVTVTEAMKRVGQVLDDFQHPTPRVTYLLDMRNGIVHAGHTVKAEHEAVLGEVATFAVQLLTARATSPGDYWGSLADLVAEHARRRMDAIEAAYARKIRRAREEHERFFASMSADERLAYLRATEPRGRGEDYDSARAKCPACNNTGLVVGSPDPEWEADWGSEGGVAYVEGTYVSEVRLDATSFACRVCHLTLDSAYLRLAGFTNVILTEDDADLDEATTYFTRALAEETWQGD